MIRISGESGNLGVDTDGKSVAAFFADGTWFYLSDAEMVEIKTIIDTCTRNDGRGRMSNTKWHALKNKWRKELNVAPLKGKKVV